MLDTIKKGMLLGLGVATLTEKEIRKNVNSLAKKGYLKSQDVKKLAKEILKEAKKHKERIQKLAEKEAKVQISKLDNSSRMKIEKLRKRVLKLEKDLEKQAKKHARNAALKVIKATEPKRRKKKR